MKLVSLSLAVASLVASPVVVGIFMAKSGPAPTISSRLLIAEGEEGVVHEEDPAPPSFDAPRNLRSYQERCGHRLFELRLGMGIHFVLLAQPVDESHRETCFPLVLHADASGTDGMVKEAYGSDGEDELEDGSLYLGTFPFRDIAEAYRSIPVNSMNQQDYNIVTNNCAVLMLGVMRLLNIQLTVPERQAVVDALVAADKDSGGLLANYVRESGEIERSLGLRKDAKDEHLLERLALRQIALALDGESSHWEQAAERSEAAQPISAEEHRDPLHRVLPYGSTSALRHPGERNLIVGGRPTAGQEYPFFVQAENVATYQSFPDLDLCGAALVAPDVILTVASCYLSFQYSTQVLVGSNILSTTSGQAEWRSIVSDILVHPKFDEESLDYDFALMKIEAVSLPNLQPINLNTDPANPAPGQDLVTIGYGRTIPEGAFEPPRQLQKVTVQAYNRTFCERFYPFASPAATFCAHARGTGPCRGDGGGPIFDSNLTLVGLLSYGNTCASPGDNPKVYSRVSGAIDWIQETICKLSDFHGNYSFCPAFICPVDVNLVGENNSTYVGGAALPLATGNMTKPAQIEISQSPAAGLQLEPGTSTVVTITATNSSNFTASCNWTVSVLPIKVHFFTNFTSKRGTTDKAVSYSLAVPFTGKFYFVKASFDLKLTRKKNAKIRLTYYRVDLKQPSNFTLVQKFMWRGNKGSSKTFRVTADVRFPDDESVVYQAVFKSEGIKTRGTVYHYYYGQVKKM